VSGNGLEQTGAHRQKPLMCHAVGPTSLSKQGTYHLELVF
jgi:hypothetical protein